MFHKAHVIIKGAAQFILNVIPIHVGFVEDGLKTLCVVGHFH